MFSFGIFYSCNSSHEFENKTLTFTALDSIVDFLKKDVADSNGIKSINLLKRTELSYFNPLEVQFNNDSCKVKCSSKLVIWQKQRCFHDNHEICESTITKIRQYLKAGIIGKDMKNRRFSYVTCFKYNEHKFEDFKIKPSERVLHINEVYKLSGQKSGIYLKFLYFTDSIVRDEFVTKMKDKYNLYNRSEFYFYYENYIEPMYIRDAMELLTKN